MNNSSPQQDAGCCSFSACPYGPKIAAPFILLGIAYIFFNTAAFGCNTFKFESLDLTRFIDDYDYDDNDFDYESYGSSRNLADTDGLRFGYWGVQDPRDGKKECFPRNDDALDVPLKLGRGVGIAGAALGGVAIVIVMLGFCLTLNQGLYCTVGILVGIFMCLFCIAMFAGIATEKCIPGSDDIEDEEISYCLPAARGYLLIPSFIFWIAGSIPLCCCMKPRRRGQDAEDAAWEAPVAYADPDKGVAAGRPVTEVHQPTKDVTGEYYDQSFPAENPEWTGMPEDVEESVTHTIETTDTGNMRRTVETREHEDGHQSVIITEEPLDMDE